MALVLVNFRLEEDVKKKMEQACREMGLTMTTAFTMFAAKVGREKRIPFEITAQTDDPKPMEVVFPLEQYKQRAEALHAEVRMALTAIHTAIPSSITGLCMEHIRLLCGDQLKDKAAAATAASRKLFSPTNDLSQKDPALLEEYLDALTCLAEELRVIEGTLVPTLKAWSGGDTGVFELYEQRLSAISHRFEELSQALRRFLASCSPTQDSAHALSAKLDYWASLLEGFPELSAQLALPKVMLAQYYDLLTPQTKAHLKTFYLPTLERAIRELRQAQLSGAPTGEKEALCARACTLLSQVLMGFGAEQDSSNTRDLQAQITAMERFAALRGDLPHTLK